MVRRGIENLPNHDHVLELLEKLEQSNSDHHRHQHARTLANFVLAHDVESVLLESGLHYSRILFKEFINHNVPTYVLEQL